MNTVFLLMAQYDGMAVIPAEKVVKDYFPHLDRVKFLRKVSAGEIKLPIVRAESNSQKAARGVHIQDLADYIDRQREAAVKEMNGIR